MASEEHKKKAAKRLTKAQWTMAKEMWRSGEFTLAKLSAQFKISREALSKRFKRDGVIKGEKSIEDSVSEAVRRKAEEDVEIIAKRVRETREQIYTWTEMLTKKAMAEIAQAIQNKLPVSTVDPQLKTLQRGLEIIRASQDIRYKTLGLDKDSSLEEKLPELVVRGLTEEEEESIRSRKSEVVDEWSESPDVLAFAELPEDESIEDADGEGAEEAPGESDVPLDPDELDQALGDEGGD